MKPTDYDKAVKRIVFLESRLRRAEAAYDDRLGKYDALNAQLLTSVETTEGEYLLRIDATARADALAAQLAEEKDECIEALRDRLVMKTERDAANAQLATRSESLDELLTTVRTCAIGIREACQQKDRPLPEEVLWLEEAAADAALAATATATGTEAIRADERDRCATYLDKVCSLWQAAQAIRTMPTTKEEP